MWYVNQLIQLLKFSMSQEVKKGPLTALTFENSKSFNFNVFPETNVVLSTCYQRQFIGQSLRENFFPMQNTLDRSYRDRLLIKRMKKKKKGVLLSLINYQCLKQAKKWRGKGEGEGRREGEGGEGRGEGEGGEGRGEGWGFQYTTKEQNYCSLK